MDVDPKPRKSLTRLEKEIRELSLTVEEQLTDKETERLLDFLRDDRATLDLTITDDSNAESFTSLFAGKRISLPQLHLIRDETAKLDSPAFTAFIDMCILAKEGKLSDLTEVAHTSFGYAVKGAPLRLLLANSGKIQDKKYLSYVFSEANIFDGDSLTSMLESGATFVDIDTVANNFQRNSNEKARSEFLSLALKEIDDPRLRIDLATLLIKEGKSFEASGIIAKIDFEEVSDRDYLEKLIEALLGTENEKQALRVVNYATYQFPKDPAFVVLHSRCLRSMGKQDDALELLDQAVFAKDTSVLNLEKADLFHEMGRTEEYLKSIERAYPAGIPEGKERVRHIDALVRMSNFDQALKEINASLSMDERNLGILKSKFNVQVVLNETIGAYDTAEKILALEQNNRDCISYILEHLFHNGDYEQFLENYAKLRASEYQIGEDLRTAAYFYEARIEEAVEQLKKATSLLNSPDVLDALFFTLRDDASVDQVMEIASAADRRLAILILQTIRGIKIEIDDSMWEMIKACNSEAVAWSVVSMSVNFRKHVVPELISSLISKKKFLSVNNMVDAIFLIYEGKFAEEMTDNRKYMYPIVNALIDLKDSRAAETKLEQARDQKKSDPFYHYMLARIQLLEEDIGASKRSIFRALGRLNNVNYLIHAMNIAIMQEDSDTVISMIDKVISLGEGDHVNLSSMYAFFSSPEYFEICNKIIDKFDRAQSNNIWIERMRRDRFMRENEFGEAEKVSRKIVVSRSKLLDDIKKHAVLLENAKKDEERAEFLQSEEKDVTDEQIDLWLGDYYFLNKNFEKALEFYQKAESLGKKPGDIRNLPETLMELGNFDAAESLLKENPGNEVTLIRLYHRTGRISEITALLRGVNVKSKEEEAAILYISRILWVNREIRDTLLEMFHSSLNLFLGKVISQRMTESRDFIGAERIMREILKHYPSDLENIRSLTDLLVETNHPAESINILTRTLRKIESKDDFHDIADRICRIYFETGEYAKLIDLYRKTPEIVDNANVQWIIRSFIETGDFDTADRLAGKFHGSLLKEDTFHEMIDEMNLKREFLTMLSYAADVFRAEYKTGRILTSEEMVYSANIPLEAVENVIRVINSEDYYHPGDERLYELLSRDVIQRSVRKSTVESILDLKIFVIFNSMQKKDVILAKNVYIYIKKSLAQKREPMLNDPASNTLLRSAIKLGLKPEPLDVSYNLNLGISDAMDIIALMEYVAKLNS